ncbi:Uncharacterized protein TCM_034477 [Theobroma cacao]|uniref:Uncharacterized protein n=1 Tax=Theobroma cacao TaxID=3641 RepID=A0A061FEQ9_THECC|nr:Uncharacterized protein TCM_034477 [Theobroma cacao]
MNISSIFCFFRLWNVWTVDYSKSMSFQRTSKKKTDLPKKKNVNEPGSSSKQMPSLSWTVSSRVACS